MDSWNRQITADLFSIGDMKMVDIDGGGSRAVVMPFASFNYPLTLAFLQFAFMGALFLALHLFVNQERPMDLLRNLKPALFDRRWAALVLTHVFSTFFLQALMLPSSMLSIGIFAATRATEVPAAAAMRTQVLGQHHGKKSNLTVGMAFAAVCIMYFSYAEMAGCACVWSGSGVALSGSAFWIIYLMLLAMPAANAVCQEAIMLQSGMHPLLFLSLQNIFACLIFAPLLVGFHLMGWEDAGSAFVMILTVAEVFMLVLWLCAQMAATSVLCVTIIHLTDSFWAVALRSVGVVLSALSMYHTWYTSQDAPLSLASPWTSFWMFSLFCSCLLGFGAIHSDCVRDDEDSARKSMAPTSTGKQLAST
jgi:hypothetical protein